MAYRALIASVLLLASGLASAGYAQLEPPSGWTTGGGGSGSVGTLKNLKKAANAGQFVGKTVITDGSLSVAGRTVKIPAALRFAVNAPRFGAGRIFFNPWLAGGALVGGWLAEKLIRWNEELQQWEVPGEEGQWVASGHRYGISADGQAFIGESREEVCSKANAHRGYVNLGPRKHPVLGSWLCYGRTAGTEIGWAPINDLGPSPCPAGWYSTPAGCLQNPGYRPIVEPEFSERLTESPMPDLLPGETPDDWPWPFQLPRINPGPAPEYEPKPAFIPTGDPAPNPNYDPDAEPSPENQPYIRPGIHLKPANTPELPWNVDLNPIDRPSPDDVPNPEPDLGGNPESPGDKPKSPDQVGLCDQYPDILACEKLRPPEPDEIESKEVDFDFQPESGFNGAGVCPQPISVTLDGRTYSFKWDGLCNALELLKPLMLAFAWVFAAFILLG